MHRLAGSPLPKLEGKGISYKYCEFDNGGEISGAGRDGSRFLDREWRSIITEVTNS